MREETLRVKKEDVAKFLEVTIENVPELYDDYCGNFVIREWTFGERERIIGDSSEQIVDGDTGKVKSRLISSIFRLSVLKNCVKLTPLKSAPTEVYLKDMPVWLGEALWEKVNSLNETMSKDEGKKFKFS